MQKPHPPRILLEMRRAKRSREPRHQKLQRVVILADLARRSDETWTRATFANDPGYGVACFGGSKGHVCSGLAAAEDRDRLGRLGEDGVRVPAKVNDVKDLAFEAIVLENGNVRDRSCSAGNHRLGSVQGRLLRRADRFVIAGDRPCSTGALDDASDEEVAFETVSQGYSVVAVVVEVLFYVVCDIFRVEQVKPMILWEFQLLV